MNSQIALEGVKLNAESEQRLQTAIHKTVMTELAFAMADSGKDGETHDRRAIIITSLPTGPVEKPPVARGPNSPPPGPPSEPGNPGKPNNGGINSNLGLHGHGRIIIDYPVS